MKKNCAFHIVLFCFLYGFLTKTQAQKCIIANNISEDVLVLYTSQSDSVLVEYFDVLNYIANPDLTDTEVNYRIITTLYNIFSPSNTVIYDTLIDKSGLDGEKYLERYQQQMKGSFCRIDGTQIVQFGINETQNQYEFLYSVARSYQKFESNCHDYSKKLYINISVDFCSRKALIIRISDKKQGKTEKKLTIGSKYGIKQWQQRIADCKDLTLIRFQNIDKYKELGNPDIIELYDEIERYKIWYEKQGANDPVAYKKVVKEMEAFLASNRENYLLNKVIFEIKKYRELNNRIATGENRKNLICRNLIQKIIIEYQELLFYYIEKENKSNIEMIRREIKKWKRKLK